MAEAKSKTIAKAKKPAPGAQARPAPRPPGRPSLYSEELAQEICMRIALGASIEEVGAMDDMPSERQIHLWRHKHPEFAQAVARAREDMANRWAEKILRTARVALGELPPTDDNQKDPRMLRVAIDGFEKYARVRMGRPPVDGGPPVMVQNNFVKVDARALPEQARDALERVLLEAHPDLEGEL